MSEGLETFIRLGVHIHTAAVGIVLLMTDVMILLPRRYSYNPRRDRSRSDADARAEPAKHECA